MDIILQGLEHIAAILITGTDDEQHIQNLKTVFSRLDSYGPTNAAVSILYGLRHFRCRYLPNTGKG